MKSFKCKYNDVYILALWYARWLIGKGLTNVKWWANASNPKINYYTNIEWNFEIMILYGTYVYEQNIQKHKHQHHKRGHEHPSTFWLL